MYQAAGFRQAGRRRNYYHSPTGERYDALTLVREL
jgi:ribosomal protein S18 acetylase RimI-like enzyme